MQALREPAVAAVLSDALVSQLVPLVHAGSSRANLAADAVRATFALHDKAIEPSRVAVDVVPDPDGVPAGWKRVESRSRKGEYSYQNMANDQRQMAVPREPVPGFADRVQAVLPQLASHEQVEAHVAMARFCDELLQLDSAGAGIDVKALSQSFLRSQLAAMRYVPAPPLDAGSVVQRLGSAEARQRFPRLLSLLDAVPQHVFCVLEQEFIAISRQVPSWAFIGWIPQMIALLNKREAAAVHAVLEDMAKQFVCLPLHVACHLAQLSGGA